MQSFIEVTFSLVSAKHTRDNPDKRPHTVGSTGSFFENAKK